MGNRHFIFQSTEVHRPDIPWSSVQALWFNGKAKRVLNLGRSNNIKFWGCPFQLRQFKKEINKSKKAAADPEPEKVEKPKPKAKAKGKAKAAAKSRASKTEKPNAAKGGKGDGENADGSSKKTKRRAPKNEDEGQASGENAVETDEVPQPVRKRKVKKTPQ